MREIKFRGKPVYHGGKAISWVYGTFKYIPCNVISPGATENGRRKLRNDKGIITEPLYGSEFEVLCDTVGQYTGLKDKNGKDIYEGDIVKCKYDDEYHPYKVEYTNLGNRMAHFTLIDSEGRHEKVSDPDEMEVIGNIHDRSATQGDACQSKNPELLKED